MYPNIPNIRPINRVTDFDDFYISYNPSVRDYGVDTTAIVLGQMEFFLILRGDHSDQLKKIAEDTGLQGCIDYFDQHIDQSHSISDHVKGQLIGTVENLLNQKEAHNKVLYASLYKDGK